LKKQVKKFFKQDKLKVETSLEMKKYTYDLKISETYGFEYYEELDKSIKEFFDKIEDNKLATTFVIVGDFDLLKTASIEDCAAFLTATVNIFAGYLVIPKTSSGNGRLAVPKSMDEMHIGSMTLREMANRKMRFPEFRIEVLNLKGKSVFEVF